MELYYVFPADYNLYLSCYVHQIVVYGVEWSLPIPEVPGFKSNFFHHLFTVNSVEKTISKEKRLGIAQLNRELSNKYFASCTQT